MAINELYLATRDSHNGPHNWFRPLAGHVDSLSLTAGVNTNYTVPNGATRLILSATADFYCKAGGTASVPGTVTDGTASELNPVALNVREGDVIGFISAVNAVITISVWR